MASLVQKPGQWLAVGAGRFQTGVHRLRTAMLNPGGQLREAGRAVGEFVLEGTTGGPDQNDMELLFGNVNA